VTATADASGTRRTLRVLYAAGFVTAFGAHAVAANLGRYALGHHTSLLELGILLGLYDGAEVVLKPVFGALADRVGAKPVLIGGLIGFAAASAGFVLANQPHWLGGARFAQGAAAAAFSPAASVLVASVGGTKRTGRAFGGYGGAKGLGYLAGPIAGGALVAVGGYPLLFGFLAVLAAVVAVVAARSVPTVTPARRRCETILDLYHRLRRSTFVIPVCILAAGTAALSTGIGFLPVVGQEHGLRPFATGAIASLLASVAALVQPRAGARFDTHAHAAGRYSAAALAAAAAGFAVAALTGGTVGLILAAILIGCGVGVSTPLGFAMLAHHTPAERMGQTMGAAEVGRELGDAGGPLLVGALSTISLTLGLAGLATALACIAAIVRANRTTANDASPPTRDPSLRPTTDQQDSG
jgi:DHA1 family tetracycline resistance protein-like MFS transporter